MLQKPSVEARQQLTILSRQVANAVSEIVHAAEAIKGKYMCLGPVFLNLFIFVPYIVLDVSLSLLLSLNVVKLCYTPFVVIVI